MRAVGSESLGWAGQFDTGTVFHVRSGRRQGQLGRANQRGKKTPIWVTMVNLGEEGHTTNFVRRVHRFALSIAAGEKTARDTSGHQGEKKGSVRSVTQRDETPALLSQWRSIVADGGKFLRNKKFEGGKSRESKWVRTRVIGRILGMVFLKKEISK